MGSRLRREWRTKSDGATKIENRAEGRMVGSYGQGDGKGLDKAVGIGGEA